MGHRYELISRGTMVLFHELLHVYYEGGDLQQIQGRTAEERAESPLRADPLGDLIRLLLPKAGERWVGGMPTMAETRAIRGGERPGDPSENKLLGELGLPLRRSHLLVPYNFDWAVLRAALNALQKGASVLDPAVKARWRFELGRAAIDALRVEAATSLFRVDRGAPERLDALAISPLLNPLARYAAVGVREWLYPSSGTYRDVQ